MKRNYLAADLFCGAGGTSTGLLEAAQELGINVKLIAVNHWDIAIATHTANHPDVTHRNSDLGDIDPREMVPSGKLRLLVASPECTFFSRARGGKPMSNQGRASAKYLLRWMAALDIEDALMENVPEFQDWGPLHRKGDKAGLPIKSRKGEYFHRFIKKIEEHGYQVKWRVLNAADYGDPTTRKRLFIIARKHKPVRFPEASHFREAKDMFGAHLIWKPAREIIDWSIKGESIFHRKRPLAPNTMRRIIAGLQKFGGKAFVIGQQSGATPRDVGQPLPTVAGAGAIALCEPFIISQFQHGVPKSVDEPLGTITTTSRGIGLVEPFIMAVNHGPDDKRSYSLNDPMPTVTSVDAWALVEPFVVMLNGTDKEQIKGSNRSVKDPLPTVTSTGHLGLVEPFLIPFYGERNKAQTPRTHSIDEPIPTIPGSNKFALIEPFLVEYYGTGNVSSIDEPLKTQTGRDRFGLVQPIPVEDKEGKTYMLDILFRMLRPHELAAAMSFPASYQFKGSREQIVKQIGNAVPVNLAKALCKTLLES